MKHGGTSKVDSHAFGVLRRRCGRHDDPLLGMRAREAEGEACNRETNREKHR